jgi:hypothetical protein
MRVRARPVDVAARGGGGGGFGPPRRRRRLGVRQAAREAPAGHVEDGLAAVVDARPVPRDAAHVVRLLRHLLLLLLHQLDTSVGSAGAEEVPVAADGLLGAGVDGDAGGGRGLGDATGSASPEPAPGPAAGLGVRVLRELVEERLDRAGAGVVGVVRVGGDPVVGSGVVDGAAGGWVPQRARALQGQEVPHQRGRRRRRGPRGAAPPPGRAVGVGVGVVVAQVDAVGQVRVAAEVVPATAAARWRRHCAGSTSPARPSWLGTRVGQSFRDRPRGVERRPRWGRGEWRTGEWSGAVVKVWGKDGRWRWARHPTLGPGADWLCMTGGDVASAA